MSLDVTDAIALARDLLHTSNEFRAHDPDLAAQFAGRAFEICDDLGIDRALIGEASIEACDQPLQEAAETPDPVEVTPHEFGDDTRQAGEQLRALLQQQARVLQNARGTEAEVEEARARKRSFWRFGRSENTSFGSLQSA